MFCSKSGICFEITFVLNTVNVPKPRQNMKSDNVRKYKSATCSKWQAVFFEVIIHLEHMFKFKSKLNVVCSSWRRIQAPEFVLF